MVFHRGMPGVPLVVTGRLHDEWFGGLTLFDAAPPSVLQRKAPKRSRLPEKNRVFNLRGPDGRQYQFLGGELFRP